jgi:hypothetical protein
VEAQGKEVSVGTVDIAGLRAALHDPTRRRDALESLARLTVEERERFFADLVELASVGHADVDAVRAQILRLPRAWVLAHIEASAERLLDGAEPWEEHRRLLELYAELDPELAHRLAARAAKHADPDVREAGADFLARLRAT